MLGELPLEMVLMAGVGVGALMSWLASTFGRRGPAGRPGGPPPERGLGPYRGRDGDVADSAFEPLTGAELAAWRGDG